MLVLAQEIDAALPHSSQIESAFTKLAMPMHPEIGPRRCEERRNQLRGGGTFCFPGWAIWVLGCLVLGQVPRHGFGRLSGGCGRTLRPWRTG